MSITLSLVQLMGAGQSGTTTFVEFTESNSYLDEDFEIDHKFGDDHVEYWIKAKISSTQESLEGNHIQLDGTSFIQWKISGNESNNYLDYRLNQNYPNPFNPSTIISYRLPENSYITLKVYNSIGETVTELVKQKQEKGKYSVDFNSANLPSGIYFYRIQTENFSDVKKMILLR